MSKLLTLHFGVQQGGITIPSHILFKIFPFISTEESQAGNAAYFVVEECIIYYLIKSIINPAVSFSGNDARGKNDPTLHTDVNIPSPK